MDLAVDQSLLERDDLVTMSHPRKQQQQHGFAPAPSTSSYRDILKFEQRLLQNAENLATQKRKYEAFLAIIVVCIAVLAYRVFLAPSIYTLVHYSYIGMLLIATTMLGLFFATGMYHEKIVRARKFVPQANRSLRPLNMHLNMKTSTGVSSWFTRGRKRRQPSMSNPTSPTRSPRTVSKTLEGEKSERPTSPSSRQASGALPPASNPRGELIFSNRVDTSFKEGYEKFRADWERRRKDRPVLDASTSSTAKRMDESSDMASSSLMNSTQVSALSISRESTPTSSRSPSPELSHSRISSQTSSGPPSPRSLLSNEQLYSSPFLDAVKKEEASYQEFFDGEHQIRI